MHHLLIEACEPLLTPTRPRCEALRRGCRDAGLREFPDKALLAALVAADARHEGLPRPLPAWEDELGFWAGYYGDVLGHLDLCPSQEVLHHLISSLVSRSHLTVHPELPGIVQGVRRAGRRVILVADWYGSFRQTLANSGLLDLFPEVFLAAQQGVYLEGQNGLLDMLRRLGLRPGAVDFLGSPRAAMAEVGIRAHTSDQLASWPTTG